MLPRFSRLPLESSLGTAPLYPISCRAPSKREMLPNSAAIVTAEICAMPRNACKSLTTSCNSGEASLTASAMACSRRTTRSPASHPTDQDLSVGAPGLHRNRRRSDHLALDSQFRQLPVEYVARRTSFIAGPQMLRRTQLPHQLASTRLAWLSFPGCAPRHLVPQPQQLSSRHGHPNPKIVPFPS